MEEPTGGLAGRREQARGGWPRRGLLAALLAAAAVAGAGLPSFAPATYAAVIAVGVVVLGAACRTHVRTARARERPALWWPWAVACAAFAGLEAWALLDPAQPTVSDLMDPVLAEPVWRGLAWGVWLLAGWGVVRR
ncbi:hypothetical protein [Thermoactinospora rubra]|uniref:hypothetical protein n=1 Tax=Thermoactinospora rubra TaxID=1088767 RepID=UPI000A102DA1|nr:hypothetical protein [Thermoactinospora rubra]